MTLSASGGGLARDGGTPAVLRLLPHVHHPPARVLVPEVGEGNEARALDARGYRVTVMGGASPAPGITRAQGAFLDVAPVAFDLLCEAGAFGTLDGDGRARYVEAAARALRPGGLLFGAFPVEEAGAGGLIAQMSPRFDVARLEPSGGDNAGAAPSLILGIFVRR
ncbi:MAG: hypothetical protein Q8P18_00795 [Pseudomonadota bacterium]|nr:hypothetical protein [Pseudomonadota bacterium]